jgi:cell division protein FtsQ
LRARKGGTTIQEELYPTPDDAAREELDDARLLDLDAEKESPFLRAQKRVSARRSPLPKKTAAKLLWAVVAVSAAAVCAVSAAAFYHFSERSWRYRLQSSDNIELAGLHNVSHSQIMEVMGADIGRNIFFIPLDQRRKQLEQIPWVGSASVMRFAPDRIKIDIRERTPVAFARLGSKIMLIDAGGVLMDLSSRGKYSFPVIVGMSSAEPLSTRAARMKIYNEVVRQLDSGGGHYSQNLSEVDLSDVEDVKALTNDSDGGVLVHLGSSNYLDRFKIYVAHLREWRQQFQKVESVDLRYDRQIVVNPDLHGAPRPMVLSAAAARAAVSAGVKPAALISREPSSGLAAHSVNQLPPTGKRVANSSSPRAKPAAWRKRKSAVRKASFKVPQHPAWAKAQSAAIQKPSAAITKGQAAH